MYSEISSVEKDDQCHDQGNRFILGCFEFSALTAQVLVYTRSGKDDDHPAYEIDIILKIE